MSVQLRLRDNYKYTLQFFHREHFNIVNYNHRVVNIFLDLTKKRDISYVAGFSYLKKQESCLKYYYFKTSESILLGHALLIHK